MYVRTIYAYTYVCSYVIPLCIYVRSNDTLNKDLPMVTNPLDEKDEHEKADKLEGEISTLIYVCTQL